jgi:periplasmic copper chaperone A
VAAGVTRALHLARLLACALALAACGGEPGKTSAGRGEAHAASGGLAVYAPRIPVPASDVAALYLVVADNDGDGDRLIGAQCAVGDATLHETRQEGDRVRMLRASEGLLVPAHGELRLEPGGAHVMLTGLRERLAAGERVHVTLEFERAGRLALEVPVVSVEAEDVALAPEAPTR